MKARLARFTLMVKLIAALFLIGSGSALATTTIDVWYGDNQQFGHLGNPQKWVNILGNVSSTEGLKSFKYSLNNGPQYTVYTSDNPRLANPGDFNIEIAITDLISGLNEVEIQAKDNNDQIYTKTVEISYTANSVWPSSYSIDWSTVTNIQDAVQVVDGQWTLENGTVRTVETGYDRLLNIGDVSWQNYEVEVPVTINWVDPSKYRPGIGVLMRWEGHHEWDWRKPSVGWWPMGAIAWYRYGGYYGDSNDRLRITGNEDTEIASSGKTLSEGITYIFKARVETPDVGEGSWYRFKVWPQSEQEPAGWDLEAQEAASDPQYGSLLLVSHYIDASFGNVTVTALDAPNSNIPPTISDISISAYSNSATISWTTDKVANSAVDYGVTQSYGDTSSSSDYVLVHTHTLENLVPGTEYNLELSNTDLNSLTSSTGNMTFTTLEEGELPPGFALSDSFETGQLENHWSVVDPVGDGSVSVAGGNLTMQVPAGTSHDVWGSTKDVLQVTQGHVDTDFELEIKFDSEPSQAYQLQGILIEQDADDFLRFDFYHDGNNLRAFAGSFSGGSSSSEGSTALSSGSPLYMRVKREGNNWTQSYSYDGSSWVIVNEFSRPLTITNLSLFAGNAGAAPAFDVVIDHFLIEPGSLPIVDVTAPIISNTAVATNGDSATITWQTDEPASSQVAYGETTGYELGNEIIASLSTSHSITLTGLTMGNEYHFQLTSEDGAGNAAVSNDYSFTAEAPQPPVITDISVSATDTSATITWTTDKASDSVVNYGATQAYGLSESATLLTTSHSITLNGLSPESTYQFAVSSTDSESLSSTSTNQSFTTQATGNPGGTLAENDEFSGTALDARWSEIDPEADGTVSVSGGRLSLAVPGGSSHDVWSSGNDTLQVSQATITGDFEAEVKFDSEPSSKYQIQGLIVGEDENDFIRFDFFHDGNSLRVFAASFVGGSPSVVGNAVIASGNPLYMRVKRIGNSWTQSYSFDGVNWTAAASFSRAMDTNSVAIFAGNAGGNPPAFTALVDHFHIAEGALPIEDSTSPSIDNLLAAVSGDQATITWDTNEAATGLLRYGTTQSYELGQVDLTTPATSHTVDLTGLALGETYHYQIEVSDASDNTTVSGDYTFVSELPTAPVISNINVVAGETSATISWTTDKASDSHVNYGQNAVLDATASTPDLVTNHSITLNSLSPDTSYDFEVVSTDANDLTTTSTMQSFTTTAQTPETVAQSDDFNGLGNHWTLVNPLGDGQASASGGQLQIFVPGGTSHDVWKQGNDSVRVAQATTDTDFETEVKFSSQPVSAYQMQGLLINQDDSNFIRYDFYHDGDNLKVFAASFNGGSPSVRTNQTIVSSANLSLRVQRVGDTWTLLYSTDGSSWNTATSFDFGLTVSSIGVFAGNAGSSPEFTALVDYFLYAEGGLPSEDTVAPEISSLNVSTGSDVAYLAWNTNEPAASFVSYGTSTNYELGSTPTSAYVTAHDVQLSGLSAGTTYYYQITATDQADNASTTSGSFEITQPEPPVISNINVTTGENNAVITWTTDKPATSVVNYGADANYGLSVSGTGNNTSHSLEITGLSSATTYHFQVSSTDGDDLTTASADQTFTTDAEAPGPTLATADTFDGAGLDAKWSIVDAVGDGTVTQSGGTLNLAVPSGTSHDIWTNKKDGLRVVQATADGDFELEVKFNSLPTQKYQLQGILVEETAGNFLRFDFYHNGSSLNIFAASFANFSASVENSAVIASGNPVYMRVKKLGNTWTQSYSFDGENWTVAAEFSHSLTANSIALFAGNAGSSPAFTAIIDHFLISEGSLPIEDVVAPTVSNLAADYDGSDLIVTWNTDEPATSSVDYGLDNTYSEGTISNSTLATSHSATIADVNFGTTYFVRVTVTDGANNTSLEEFTHTIEAPQPPVISNIQVSVDETTATLTWETDNATDSVVNYGTDSGYGSTESNATLTVSHSVQLTNLQASTTYHYQVSGTDSNSLSSASGDLTFTTADAAPVLQTNSDDFESGLDPAWNFVSAKGDGSIMVTGGKLTISVPSGTSHDIWKSGNDAVQIQQEMANGDFSAIVKFDSIPTMKYQLQGLIIGEDDSNFARFDFYSDGNGLRIFAADFANMTPSVKLNQSISSQGPLYMKVSREGNLWTQEYSYDGSTWNQAASFYSDLEANYVSLFGGNAGGSPAFDVIVEEFIYADDANPNNYPPIPTTPANLTSVALGSDTVLLSWEASNDDQGVTAYDVYRNNVLVTSVTELSFSDSGLTEASYDYEIIARDADGNSSDAATIAASTDTFSSATWWDANWPYRTFIAMQPSTVERADSIVEMDVNFSQLIAAASGSGDFDPTKIRCHEIDNTGVVITTDVPCQFDAASNYDAGTNAAGKILIEATGITAANATRYYHVYFDVTGGTSTAAPSFTASVTVNDNVIDESLSSFEIVTDSATYYYQKDAGGFSSVVDSDGNDWVSYSTAAGSAGAYRGIPNLVYPDGHFHPGATSSVSTLLNSGPLKATIHSITNDGNWEAIWEIYPNHATMTVLNAASEYWFLYEGTPGGSLETTTDFSVRSDGTTALLSESWSGDLVGDEWVYFADPGVSRSLYMANHQNDVHTDSYRDLNDQMTIFGFGRNVNATELTATPAKYTFGLIETTDYLPASAAISNALGTVVESSSNVSVAP